MKDNTPMGLNELMIVNPGSPGTAGVFLGKDGILYQVRDLDHEPDGAGLGEYFLGDDGALYQPLEGLGDEELEVEPGQYFLGDDGTLYQVGALERSEAAETPDHRRGAAERRGLGRYFLGDDGTLFELVE